MRPTIFICFLLLSTAALFAGEPVSIKIWPNGAPNDNGMTEQVGDYPLYVPEPTLDVYVASNPNGKAIVACPGGGYAMLAKDYEGHDLADWLNAQGITYAVLTYRMPNCHKDIPLSDAQQALRVVREHSEEWKIDKVGIMGFSAGGHLASTAATHFTDSVTRPDFQILFYPVITMNPEYTHIYSRYFLLGRYPTEEEDSYYSNELQVTEQTPPAFILVSSDDDIVPVENSVNYYLALLEKGVSATMHIYSTGGHGWGFKDSFIYKRQWTGELEKWLNGL